MYMLSALRAQAALKNCPSFSNVLIFLFVEFALFFYLILCAVYRDYRYAAFAGGINYTVNELNLLLDTSAIQNANGWRRGGFCRQDHCPKKATSRYRYVVLISWCGKSHS